MFATKLKIGGLFLIAAVFAVLLFQRNSARADLAEERRINTELNFSLTEFQNALQHEKTAVNDLNNLIKGKDLELASLSKETKKALKNETCNSTGIPDSLFKQLQQQYRH